jgi:hypothetical protein
VKQEPKFQPTFKATAGPSSPAPSPSTKPTPNCGLPQGELILPKRSFVKPRQRWISTCIDYSSDFAFIFDF